MKRAFPVVGLVALALSATVACSAPADDLAGQSSQLRSVTTAEALADFDQLAETFRSLYGALDRKQARYGFDFETHVREIRARIQNASTDAEFQGLFVEFVARFKDAHISLSPAFVGNDALISDDSHSFSLPVSVMPIGNTYVVYDVAPGAANQVKVGDELVTIDGESVEYLVGSLLRYAGTPNVLAAQHMASARVTTRSPYVSLMTGIHAGSSSTLSLRGADGNVRDVSLPWTESAHAVPPSTTSTPAAGASTKQTLLAKSSLTEEIVRAELSKMGARVPFFMTDGVKAQLGLTEVKPSQDALTKFNVTADAAAKIDYFAGTYDLHGKKVLLVRLPDYTPTDVNAAVGYLEALFTEQQPNVDALVFDQTHNPGGNLFFAMSVAQLLAKQPFANVVQKNHADRLWVLGFASAADQVRAQAPDVATLLMSEAATIDQAYSAHKPLTEPMPIFDAPTTLDPDPAHWNKPLLLLVDELSVSCGDFVPALVKWNHIAPIFGQTTMGGGGNVEEVATLTNTRWTLNLSRGLGTVFDSTGAYPDERFVEDNGVKPDVTYSHTLADFRAGYVGYVAAFNTALAQQLAPPPAQP